MAGRKIAITIRRDGAVKAITEYIPLLEDLLQPAQLAGGGRDAGALARAGGAGAGQARRRRAHPAGRRAVLTPRYAHLAGELEALPNRLEVRIGRDGTVLVNGFAPLDRLEALLDGDLPALRATGR